MLKYGDEIWTFFGGWFKYSKRYLSFYRFRIDPVPDIYGKYRGRYWYRRPKTYQERRLTYKCNRKYVRGRRQACNLPNAWDDIRRGDSWEKRSWKKSFRCKKQWMKHKK